MTQRNIAESFLKLTTSGQVQKAYQLYVAENFKHHNMFFPGDRATLLKAMEENAIRFPHKIFELKRTVAEGDFVVTHSKIILSPGEAVISAMHLFKIENDLIVELWDLGQMMPANSPNLNGVF